MSTTPNGIPAAPADKLEADALPLISGKNKRARHKRSKSLTNRATMPLLDSNEINKASEQYEEESPKQHNTRQKTRHGPISVRTMLMQDMSSVFHLGNSIFTAAEFPNMYRTWDDFSIVENFEGSPEFCFVATDKDKIVGFLLGETLSKSTVATRGYIQWVAVSPTYRRQGVATQLLQAFADEAKVQNITLLLADTQGDNEPAIKMFEKIGISHKTDHVYLSRQLVVDDEEEQNADNHVDDNKHFHYTYTAQRRNSKQKVRITIRNMELDDLYQVYCLGEQVFTQKSPNLYNFWDQHLVLQSYLADSDYCAVATTKNDGVIGFCFGTTIEKPKSSWKYGYIVWIGCHNDYQGLGLANQLYNIMVELFHMDRCRILMIDTQSNNEGALRFFYKLGFGNDEQHVYLSNAAM